MSTVAIVTGHSRGLGAAIAEDLRTRGAIVHGVSSREVDFADTVALTAWLQAMPDLFKDCTQALLVNNAGLVTPVAPPGRQGAKALARAVAVNVSAPLMMSDAFVAATAHCADRRIAHVSSGAGRSAYPGWSAYCATKAALDMHAQAVQMDRVPKLRIASVAPGVIDTDMQAQIRGVDVADFPNKARFEALKRDGGLMSPQDAARRFNDFLLSPRFGEDAIADIR